MIFFLYYLLDAKWTASFLLFSLLMTFFAFIGHIVIYAITKLGHITSSAVKIFNCFRFALKSRKLLVEQMAIIGANSLPLVLLIGAFTGAIAAIQATILFEKFGLMEIAKPFLGSSIATAVFQELTPVLTALVIAGRVGASMAAQIGSMVVSEQVDALEMMAIDKYRFLAMPRVAAALLMMPILAVFSSLVAMLGAYIMVLLEFDISPDYYLESIINFFYIIELVVCIVKSALFGVITALVGVYVGFSTLGGAEGVGNSTVKAFTISAALILITDAVWGIIF